MSLDIALIHCIVSVSLVMLCLMRNFLIAPRDREPITLPTQVRRQRASLCYPILNESGYARNIPSVFMLLREACFEHI